MGEPENAVDSSEAMEDVEEVEDTGPKSSLAAELMKNPQVLAAVQSRLNCMVGAPSGYIASLPKSVKRRIKALKRIQHDLTKHEAEFFKQVHVLECKYHKVYSPLYEKRQLITSGTYDPTDEESEWPSDDEEEEDEEPEKKSKIEDKRETEEDTTKGIPEFWLTTMKNVPEVAVLIQDHDEPILRHLNDVRVKYTESNPMGFVLEFVFSTNDFFTNQVLTKEYEMSCSPDDDNPFTFEGPEIIKCKGCTIDWAKGQNVTVKTITKKQKNKTKDTVKTITKTVQTESFFNFFSPPPVPEDKGAEIDDETQQTLSSDFEIGHFFRDKIIPRAVLFFTGEALEDEEYEEEEEEGGEGEGDEEEDDPDFVPKPSNKLKKGAGPADCAQQ